MRNCIQSQDFPTETNFDPPHLFSFYDYICIGLLYSLFLQAVRTTGVMASTEALESDLPSYVFNLQYK